MCIWFAKNARAHYSRRKRHEKAMRYEKVVENQRMEKIEKYVDYIMLYWWSCSFFLTMVAQARYVNS